MILKRFLEDMTARAVALILVFLAAAGLLVYGNSFHNNFISDDSAFVVRNESIRTFAPLTKFFDPATASSDPILSHDAWRPMTTFSYALTYRFFGLDPAALHATNVTIHILNAFLIFWLVYLIAGSRSPLITAFITSLVFLIHPVQVESVAWVAQRSNVLFLFFFAPAFICYIYFRSSSGRDRSLLFGASLLLFILSLLSKEMAISLPLIIFAYEYILGSKDLKVSLKQSLPYFAVVFAYVLARQFAIGRTAMTAYWAGGFIPQMLTMVKGFALYVKLMVIPYPLSAHYLFPAKHSVDMEVLISGLLLAGIIYLGWRLRKSQPVISFGIFLFFLSLAPVSNLVPIKEIIKERFLYLAAAGFGMVLGQAAVQLSAVKRRLFNIPLNAIVAAGLIFLFVVYGIITVNRNETWKDLYAFTAANLKTCPQCAEMHYNMGQAYASRGEFDKAVEEFEFSLKIDPQYERTLIDMGVISPETGEAGAVIAQYRRSVQKRVDLFEGLHNLGVAYFNKGDYREAVKILEKASSLKPGDLEARTNLANAYAYAGNLEKAISICEEILREDPGMARARHDLGIFYGAAGHHAH
jgi:tetratricopeptide (TPR) repeat protein